MVRLWVKVKALVDKEGKLSTTLTNLAKETNGTKDEVLKGLAYLKRRGWIDYSFDEKGVVEITILAPN